jgi:antitoxin component YwqK of YwqJK toxin-antitoxin module
LKFQRPIFLLFLLNLTVISCSLKNEPEEILIPEKRVLAKSMELEQRGALLFYGDSLFSGYVMEKHGNGNLKSQLPYWKGKKQGIFLGWYETGQLHFKRYYADGKKTGEHQAWWWNGKQKFSYYFKKGKYEGTQIEYFSSGDTLSVRNFKNGQEEGSQKIWSIRGELTTNYVIKNNKRYGFAGKRDCVSSIE